MKYFIALLFISLNLFADIKWHPGHYATIPPYTNRDLALKEISTTPLIRGVQLSYTWRELETTKGVYDFSKIDKDIEFYGKSGKRIVIFLKTKSFIDLSPAPDYMSDYVCSYVTRSTGKNIKLWLDETKFRLEELIRELALKYDTHPMIEAITFNETALGCSLTTTQIDGYFNNLIYILEKAKFYFKHTNVIQFVNFPKSIFTKLTDAMLLHKIGMGGPDTFPNDSSLVDGIYKFYPKFNNVLPVTPSVQHENYITKCFNCAPELVTVEELYEYTKTNLFATHVFWTRSNADSFAKVLNMLNVARFPKDPAGGLNSKCPSNYDYCVDKIAIDCPVSDKIYSQVELDKIISDITGPLNLKIEEQGLKIQDQELKITELNSKMNQSILDGIKSWKLEFLDKVKTFIAEYN